MLTTKTPADAHTEDNQKWTKTGTQEPKFFFFMFRLSWPMQNFLILCIINFGYCSSETFYLWLKTNKERKCWKCTFLLKNSALKNGRTNLSHRNNVNPPPTQGGSRISSCTNCLHEWTSLIGQSGECQADRCSQQPFWMVEQSGGLKESHVITETREDEGQASVCGPPSQLTKKQHTASPSRTFYIMRVF